MFPTCHPVADDVVRLDFTLFERSRDFAFLNVTCPATVSASCDCETEGRRQKKRTLAALKGQGIVLNVKDKTPDDKLTPLTKLSEGSLEQSESSFPPLSLFSSSLHNVSKPAYLFPSFSGEQIISMCEEEGQRAAATPPPPPPPPPLRHVQ